MTDVVKDRNPLYGDPVPNMERTAKLWSAYLETPITAHDVAMCMIFVKASRAKVSDHKDNYVDIAGYADIAEQVWSAS